MNNSMGERKDISTIAISALDEVQRLKASSLVMESLPTYYTVEGIDEFEMATAVAGLIGEPGSEIEEGYAALSNNQVVGILTFLRSELLATARIVGAQALYKRLSQDAARKFRAHLKQYDAGFGTVPEGSIYLSRFAIDKEYRGSGLANQMMELFLSQEDVSGVSWKKFSLHVDQKNERAVAFYRKHGFATHHIGSRYLTMVRV